jgi:glucose dehydrogenase
MSGTEMGVQASAQRAYLLALAMVLLVPQGAVWAQARDAVFPAPGRLGMSSSPQGVDRPPAELISPSSADCLHWCGNPGSWGYSALEQITTENVDDLQFAWVWQMEVDALRGWQAPWVRDGVLFLSNLRNVI